LTELDRDPVPLVHVVARRDLRVPFDQCGRVTGVSLHGDVALFSGQIDQREHPPADLEHPSGLAERVTDVGRGKLAAAL